MRHGDRGSRHDHAYGGIFVAGSLAWGIVMDGFKPDRYDYLGATICLVGATGIMFAKGAGQESREVLPPLSSRGRLSRQFPSADGAAMARKWRENLPPGSAEGSSWPVEPQSPCGA